MDYNRWVKDLNGYSREEFLNHVGEKFRMTPPSFGGSSKGERQVSMYLDGQWYELEGKNGEKPYGCGGVAGCFHSSE